ncbi:hypothetical protein [Desertihabitans brevis]|uniref:hypothetical protein n=1 Tax=Desertihabitans brevis TaxID=2268447 RepID=UPI0018F671B8|nr:hypothetical protein [Desertihabitans brevis]
MATMVGWVAMVGLAGWFAVRTWVPRLAAADRRSLVSDGVSALVVLLLGRAITPMPGVLSWWWVALAVGVAVTVARAVWRGAGLPWTGPAGGDVSTHPRWTVPALVSVSLHALLGVLAVVVLV